MRIAVSTSWIVGCIAACLMIGGCETTVDPVVPETVETSINNNPDDSQWAIFDAEFASGEIQGSKDDQGRIDRIERVVIRSKRTDRIYTADFDTDERVATLTDDLGNQVLFTYLESSLRVDYISAEGEVGDFTVDYADLPDPPAKPKQDVAEPRPVPHSVRILVSVTENGGVVRNAYVWASVNYLNTPLGTYYHDTGDFAGKYFTYFINRRQAFDATYDECTEATTRVNQVLTVAGGALYIALNTCTAVAGPTPVGGICAFLNSGLVAAIEVGIVAGGVGTVSPNHLCKDLAIPADPATATVSVHARLPSGEEIVESQTFNVHDMPDQRVLQFSINFETDTARDCAPNETFEVVDFDNGLDQPLSEPFICVSGNKDSLIFSWAMPISGVFEIGLRNGYLNQTVWAISTSNGLTDTFSSPISYGITPSNVDTTVLVPPGTLVPGQLYELTLYNSNGDPGIRFIIR